MASPGGGPRSGTIQRLFPMTLSPVAVPAPNPRRKALSLALFIFSLTLLVFTPVVRHGFLTWDDKDAISDNTDFKPPRATVLDAIWLHPTHGYHGLYVPLTYTVWWAAAHGAQTPAPDGPGVALEPGAFHALNLVFHAWAAMAVFLILRGLVKSNVPAALGALLFSIHPLQAEPVAWASTMYTPLSGALSLTGAWLYLCFSDPERSDAGGRRWTIYAVATVCFALALLAKPTVVVMPVIVAVIEVVLRGKSVKQCAPLLGWIVLGIVDVAITRENHAGDFTYHPALLARPLIAADGVAFYLIKLLAPFHLVTDYGRSPYWVIQHHSVWFLSLIPVALAVAAISLRRRAPWLLAGAAIFVLGPAAMLGLVPFSFQHFSTVADRYAYLALFGAALVAAYAIRAAQVRQWKPVVPVALVLLGVLAIVARGQADYWRDTKTLFLHNLEVNPTSVAANSNLGDLLFSASDPESRRQAIAHYRLAIAEHPDDAGMRAVLAEHLYRDGRVREAADLYREAVRIQPDYAPLQYMLGRSLMDLHDRTGAIEAFSRTVELAPDYYDTDLRLGDLLAAAGRVSEAAARYRIILQAHPRSQFVRDRLEHLQAQAGADLH